MGPSSGYVCEGQVGMMVNWDENISAVENSDIVAARLVIVLYRGLGQEC